MGHRPTGDVMNLGFRPGLAGPTSIDYEAIKRNAYRDQDILIVNLKDQRLTWVEKELLNQVAQKLYGSPRPGR